MVLMAARSMSPRPHGGITARAMIAAGTPTGGMTHTAAITAAATVA